MTIAELNASSREAFVAAVGFAFEDSPWVAQIAWTRRPFENVDALARGMLEVVREAPEERRIGLISAHPDLAGRAAREEQLTPASRGEQAAAGLSKLSEGEAAQLDVLNAAYRSRFGFPFVICAREHTKTSILAALAARTLNDRTSEIATAVDEIGKIARLRLLNVITA